MYISNLVIEGTRSCNMTCEHCLRGNPQRLKMSFDTLSNALKDVTSIGCVTFTGGEPTLYPVIVEHFIQLILKRIIQLKKNKIFDYTKNGCEYKAIYFNYLNKKEKFKVFKADPDSQDFGEPEIEQFQEEKLGPMIDTKTFKIIEY